MAKKKSAVNGSLRGGRIPAPDKSTTTSDFNPFMKAADVGKIGKKAILLLTGECRGPIDSGFGEQLAVEVKHGREVYDLPVKVNSPNHRILIDKVGDRPAAWRGKKIGVTVKHHMGNDFISIDRK